MGTKVTIQAENYEPQLQAAIDAAKRLIEFTGKGVIISIETKHGKRSMNQTIPPNIRITSQRRF